MYDALISFEILGLHDNNVLYVILVETFMSANQNLHACIQCIKFMLVEN